MINGEKLLKITNFPSLVTFLTEELKWPVELDDFKDPEDFDEMAFDWTPEEIGLPEKYSAKVGEIKQLRPLRASQPWSVFYIDFEPERLPVTVLRRVLNAFVEKKRSQSASRPTWKMQDLLFINAHGSDGERGMTFAHFSKPESGYNAVMREFMWNQKETHFTHIHQYLECLTWPEDNITQQQWREQWRSAFIGSKRKAISDSKTLAEEMALFAHEVRHRVGEVLELTRNVKSDPLQHLFTTFRKVLVHDLTEDGFADMYAQTMAYGLFTARFSKPHQHFGLDELKSVVDAIPETNPFLRNLFKQCFGVSHRKAYRIDIEEIGLARLVEMLGEIKSEDCTRILQEFGSRTGDPVIHFYEGFLHAYDATIREMRGVYYTPDPVVSYIVRSVHELLKRDFKLPLGLADTSTWAEVAERNDFEVPEGIDPDGPFVRILDPAVGTGTFLKHVIQLIHETMIKVWQREQGKGSSIQQVANSDSNYLVDKWNAYVEEHLLPRLYGFELLPAPYAVCHMRLGLYLKHDLNYEFTSGKRLNVFLTNALEPPHEFFDTDVAEFMAHEANDSNRSKSGIPFTIIIGNPPYSGHSHNASEIEVEIRKGQKYWNQNKGGVSKQITAHRNFKRKVKTWIGKLLIPYFTVDGKPLKERNPKWLNDDYVKFIRYAQWRIDKTGCGVFSYISNHGYLDNPTFRGMRESLMNSFDQMYILDLHGNVKKKETTPEGSKDENVFDIQQGVTISVMAKQPVFK